MSRKRKRREGSPLLLEMPDWSQTGWDSSQVIHLQAFSIPPLLRVKSMAVCLQSSDSTQVGECPRGKSPVFSPPRRRAEVQVPRLCRDLLRSCLSSGFVWTSQDSSPLRPPPAPCRSPTFPKSPDRSSRQGSPKSPLSWPSGESTPENGTSPVFAGDSGPGSRPSPRSCNAGFSLWSQESLTPVARTASPPAPSPVFPKSPAGVPAASESPGSSDGAEGEAEAEHLRSRSPVFDGTGRPNRSIKEASQRPRQAFACHSALSCTRMAAAAV